LKAALNSIKRIDKLVDKLNSGSLKSDDNDDGGGGGVGDGLDYSKYTLDILSEFESAMSDDMNTPKAMAVLFKLINTAEGSIKKGIYYYIQYIKCSACGFYCRLFCLQN
jgi:cysteinyl-tRNA synthetase